jgi:uncharacterized protein YkwD
MRRWFLGVAIALAVVPAFTDSAAAATPSPATAAADAQAVYQLINRERAANFVRTLNWNSHLALAAHDHNLLMAKYDMLSHQLPGEKPLGARVTATGYAWRAVAENIGETPDWSLDGILALHRMMYREAPPNDPHRRNILNPVFRGVGVDVYMDGRHHVAWLTEVFAQPG